MKVRYSENIENLCETTKSISIVQRNVLLLYFEGSIRKNLVDFSFPNDISLPCYVIVEH